MHICLLTMTRSRFLCLALRGSEVHMCTSKRRQIHRPVSDLSGTSPPLPHSTAQVKLGNVPCQFVIHIKYLHNRPCAILQTWTISR